MSETKPIKPEAKHKNQHKIPMRPTTEGHNFTDQINPELERNQPEYTEEKLKLNINAKPFISQRLENQLYSKVKPNPEVQNNFNNNSYNQNYNMNNMNRNNFPGVTNFRYSMPLQAPHNFHPHYQYYNK